MRVHVYKDASLEEAFRILKAAVQRRAFLVLLARCSVEYEGRGASKLGEGDRLIVVKPDGAVLVHRPTGYSPVNWQPESKVIDLRLEGGRLALTCIRAKPREVLAIYLTRTYVIVECEDMVDTAEFIEYIDEAELRDYLMRHPEVIEPGLKVVGIEKEAGGGFADICAVDSKGRFVVIEVKRATAGREAVAQLMRYVDYFRKLYPSTQVRGVLVAPSITKAALELLKSLGLEYKQINLEKVYEHIKRERALQSSLLNYLRARAKEAGKQSGAGKPVGKKSCSKRS